MTKTLSPFLLICSLFFVSCSALPPEDRFVLSVEQNNVPRLKHIVANGVDFNDYRIRYILLFKIKDIESNTLDYLMTLPIDKSSSNSLISLDENNNPRRNSLLLSCLDDYSQLRVPSKVKILLKHGYPANERIDCNTSVLMAFINRYDTFPPITSSINLLLDYGADPNFRGQDGTTPLLLSLRAGSDELSRILIKRGAIVSSDYRKIKSSHSLGNGQDAYEYESELSMMISNGLNNMLDQYINSYNANLLSPSGTDLLYYAIQSDNLEAVKLILPYIKEPSSRHYKLTISDEKKDYYYDEVFDMHGLCWAFNVSSSVRDYIRKYGTVRLVTK